MNIKLGWKWALLPLVASAGCLQVGCILGVAGGMIGVVQANQVLAPFFDSLGF